MKYILCKKTKHTWSKFGLALLLLLPGLLSAQVADLTGTWSNIGGGQWQSTTANGVTVTASVTLTAPSGWSSVGSGQMTLDDVGVTVFTNSSVYGRSSLQADYSWDTAPEPGTTDIDLPGDDQGSGTITFTFSEPVANPVLYIDRIGGAASDGFNGFSNSAQLSLNGGLSWTQLAGVGHFDAAASTMRRTPDQVMSTASSSECFSTSLDGTACGTVQINGTVSNISLTWNGVGVEGTGGDAIELVLEARPLPALSIAKTASTDDGGLSPGDTVNYEIVIENTGPVEATSITLTDTMPADLSYVGGSAEMTYPTNVVGSFTSPNLGPVNVSGSGTTTISFDTAGSVPAGSTLTGYSLSVSGTAIGASWLSEIDLQATYPGGTAFDLDFGDDLGYGNIPGTYSVNEGPAAVGGTAVGLYEFIWSEDFDDLGDDDNAVSDTTFTIDYEGPRTTTTEAAGAPPNLVTVADGISLLPGETMTVTYDVTIDAGASGILTNTATANATGLPTPVSDSVQIAPTAATIGKVELSAESVRELLDRLAIDQMDAVDLLALLKAWDPEQAATVAIADPETILAALRNYLDPNGDGLVAVLRWETLEERGTIGFYVERSAGAGDWIQLSGGMLPGLVTAPLGGEYQLVDPDATEGIDYVYRLIEQEAWGTQRSHGPYELRMD